MSQHFRQSKPTIHGKKWQIRWKDETGKRCSEVYSTYDDAEYALSVHKLRVEEVRRGLRVRPPADRSFAELADKWLSTRTTAKRNPKDDQSIIRRHLLPAFGELELKHITNERAAVFAADLGAEKAPQTVRNILNLLGAMLHQAVEWGWLDKAPRIRRPKKRYLEKNYRWLRTDEEVEHFLLAAKAHKWPVTHPLYATAIYTGMRAGELAGLHWDDVHMDFRIIMVQRSFSGPTKNGETRHVPILDELLPILKEWKLACPSPALVFPNNSGQMWDQSGRVFQEVLHKVLQLGGFPPKHITFHSLRHTFASHMASRGADMFKLQRVLGHKDRAMTDRYSHLCPNAFDDLRGISFGNAQKKKKKSKGGGNAAGIRS